MSVLPGKTEPLCLGDFVDPSKTLDPISFEEQLGSAFLLHHGPIGKMQVSEGLQTTMAVEGKGTDPDRPFDPEADFLVFPVRARNEDREDVIWLGRSETNDIVIPDASVSAVHAFFSLDGSGNFYLQDMNSMNGTKLDGETVPAQGLGEAMNLKSGSRIELGSVALSFLFASDFRVLIDRLIP